MARAPLLQITGLSLGYGGPPLFDGLDLVVQAGDRLALVGRNGSGKSTLMKVMAGLVEPDAGARVLPEGTGVGYLEQDPDFAGFATLGDFATASLGASETWRVEAAAEGLDLSLDMAPDRASGGERRRAALARLLAEAPDLMLLDEPTNHLDIAAIGWLEAELVPHPRGLHHDLPRPRLPEAAGAGDALARPGRGAAHGPALRRFRGLARRIWARGGPRPTQARPQDQGRGALGRRGHLRPAQAQPGPGAGAAEAAGDPRGDDRARRRRGAVAGGRGQGRQAGDRGQGHLPGLRGADGHRAPRPARAARATGWRSWGRTGRARPRFSTC
jgi:ABC-type transport system involved in cytochrome c biogenesis ATPase subunit